MGMYYIGIILPHFLLINSKLKASNLFQCSWKASPVSPYVVKARISRKMSGSCEPTFWLQISYRPNPFKGGCIGDYNGLHKGVL